MKKGVIEFLRWLKPSAHEDGRTGFLSTYEEVHVFVFGLMVGVAVPSTGIVQLISGLIGAGAAGGRIQLGFDMELIKKELPTFVVGVFISYGLVEYVV